MSKKAQKTKPQQQSSKQSPTKVNKKQKPIAQSNILQTMKNEIDFLRQFTSSEIQFLFENYDVIVFQRGMVLAKEKEVVDFVGVIVNGGAIAQKSKTKYKANSFIGHSVSIFGLEGHRHPQTITAESDGILFAIRVQALLNPSKQQIEQSIKSNIINFISQQTLCHFKGQKHFASTLTAEFQILDDKLSQKFHQSSKLLSQLYESITQPKQREKFTQQFPIYCAKQKTLIASRHSRPYLLLLLKGQVIIKSGLGLKKETKILQPNNLYNPQGFILDHNQFSNLYCGSGQVVFMIVDKERLVNNFKLGTVCGVVKYCLQYVQKVNDYAWGILLPQVQDGSSGVDKKEIWSPFRKSFNIQQIPTKKQSLKPTAKQSSNNKKKQSINTFQTLYQTYSNLPKNKLRSKQTQLTEYKQSTSERVHSSTVVKTEYSVEEKVGSSNQKLKKLQTQVLSMKEQNLTLTQTIKRLKLDLLQSQSRLKMIQVFRQINDLKGLKQHESQAQSNLGKAESKSVSLKQAFELHLKNKKLQLLVAKCAYKWLTITRQNKNKREHNSTASLLSNTMQKSLKGVSV